MSRRRSTMYTTNISGSRRNWRTHTSCNVRCWCRHFHNGAYRRGGTDVVQLVYSSNLTWNPFTNTAIGSGSFNFSFLQDQFWTKANTASQQARLGLITTPNNWSVNGYQYNQTCIRIPCPAAGTGCPSLSASTRFSLMMTMNTPIMRRQLHQPAAVAKRHTDLFKRGSWCICSGRDPEWSVHLRGRVPGSSRRHRKNSDRARSLDRQICVFRGGRMDTEFSWWRHLQPPRIHPTFGTAATEQLQRRLLQRRAGHRPE